MKKIKVFTGNDLDSAGSLMLIKWAFGDTCEIEHSISNVFNIKMDYKACDTTDYSKVFILNMIPQFKVSSNTLTFSKSEREMLEFKGKVDVSTSTTDLILKFFHKTFDNLTPNQNELIRTINDLYVDGGSKNHSIKLNAIFSFGRNKYATFYDRFADGLDEYTESEDKIINHYLVELSRVYKSLELYEHGQKQGVYIALVPDMLHKHEILDLIFKKKSPKMVFLVDLENGFISVRKQASVKMDMHKLCGSLLEGRALKNCAGGIYTEKFVDFSREFM